jgi:flagellin
MDTDAKDAANKELQQLNQELDRIGSATSFGKSKLLDGSFGATSKTASGTAVTAGANMTAAATTLSAGPTGFSLTSVDGKTAAIDVTIPTGAITPTSSGQDIARAVNTAIASALKAAGFEGSEVKMTASTAVNGDTTFSMSGTGTFAATDTVTGPPAAASLLGQIGMGATATGNVNVPGGNTGRFQVGANANERIGIAIGEVNSNTLGTAALDLTALGGPDAAIDALDKAIRSVSDTRASLGAYQNRFEHTINNLNVAVENLSASESRIRDTDVAAEMVSFTRNQILTQAGTSMLSQANQSAQGVMSLLRG